MSKSIGIDLGTTNSAIAILDEFGKPEIVPIDSDRITPSVVAFPDYDESTVSVGRDAKQQLQVEPSTVIQHVKRDMGSDVTYPMHDENYTPQQISALVIKKLVEGAEKIHGKIDSAVITTPANFSEEMRRATIQAGKIAGVEVSHIINEPTAAALAYAGSGNALSGTLMIYDLGGGTFDVTIAKIQGKEVDIITSQGDSRLGGTDFDKKLYDYVRGTFGQSAGDAFPPEPDTAGKYYEILDKVEEMKIQLSKRDVSKKVLHLDTGTCKAEVNRTDFEEQIANLLSKTEMLVETALEDANMSASDIGNILLVGGSTRVPAVRESITKLMGKEPLDAVNPDEAVALGAAIYAGLKSDTLSAVQREQLDSVSISDVANHYYGTIAVNVDEEREKVERKVSVIIRKDTPLPAEGSKTFRTIADGQTRVNATITQSAQDEDDPKFVNIVHEAELELPPNRPAGQPFKVTYCYDSNQIMHCEFLDVSSGRKIEATLNSDKLGSTEEQSASLEDFVIE